MSIADKNKNGYSKKQISLIIAIGFSLFLQLFLFQNCSQGGSGSSKIADSSALGSPDPTLNPCPQNEANETNNYGRPVMTGFTGGATATLNSGYGIDFTGSAMSSNFSLTYSEVTTKPGCESMTAEARVMCVPRSVKNSNNQNIVSTLKVRNSAGALESALAEDIACAFANKDNSVMPNTSKNFQISVVDKADDATKMYRRCMQGTVTVDVYLRNNYYNKKLESLTKQTIDVTVNSSCLEEFKITKEISNSTLLLSAADHFGQQTSIDGNWAAVLAPDDDGAGTKKLDPNSTYDATGAIYMFKKSIVSGVSNWQLHSVLRTSDLSVSDSATKSSSPNALYLKNNILVLGSLLDNSSSGRAWVYKYDSINNVWNFVTKLAPSVIGTESISFAYFGKSVSTDGVSIAIGSPGDNNKQGAVYLFDTLGNLKQKILCGSYCSSTSRNFGSSVSIEGSTLVIGAPQAVSTISQRVGVVFKYLYNSNSNLWEYSKSFPSLSLPAMNQASTVYLENVNTFKSSNEVTTGSIRLDVGSKFGEKVFISNGKIIISAPGWTNGGTSTIGLVLVVDSSDKIFKLQRPNEVPLSGFGSGLTLSSTTGCAFVGAPNDGTSNRGYVYKFCPGTINSKSTYIFDKIIPGLTQSAGDYFGFSLAISDKTLLVGSHQESSVENPTQGGATFFETN